MRFKVAAHASIKLVLAAAVLGAAAFSGMASAKGGIPQQIIVKYRDGAATLPALETLGRLSVTAGVPNVAFERVRTLATGGELIKVNRDLSGLELSRIFQQLRLDPRVEYVEEDLVMTPQFTPTDPQYSQQWFHYETAGGINAPAAWDISTGTGVTVAVLDTGYRPHVDFGSAVVGGYDFVSNATNNDGNGRDPDAADPGDYNAAGDCGVGSGASNSSWHGTHVAGIIGARQNTTGVVGVAYNATIQPVRVLGRCGGSSSDIAEAIIWASGGAVSGVPTNPNPAKVINLSLGGSGSCGSTTQAAINSARSRNTTVVIAAGNSNSDVANFSPANCTGVITVASVGRTGGRAYYSNYGSLVEIAAPGGDQSTGGANGILSTLNAGATVPGADNYAFYQGTSMATPVVAGVAAQLYAQNPSITPDGVLTKIQASARAFPASCTGCGSGIINAAK